MEKILLKNSELEKLTNEEKIKYYNNLKEYCKSLNNNLNITKEQKLISNFSSKGRNYDYIIRGFENIPSTGCILMCNHSNSHDALTPYEILTNYNMPLSLLISSEGLNPIIIKIFKKANATFVNRIDKKSRENSIYELSSKVLNGGIGVVFGEGTWNLHPIKPMLNINKGITTIAAITEKPIIPTIIEYVESPLICKNEKELYSRCIITFGKPITIFRDLDLIKQTALLQNKMEIMRRQGWEELGIRRNNINDVNPILYVNHTWLKEYGPTGINYDTKRESKYLLSTDGSIVTNEYCIDEYGNFVPGELKRNMKIRGF